ncbi:fasciclin-2-like protein, partial [Leptotrombidium deliense]
GRQPYPPERIDFRNSTATSLKFVIVASKSTDGLPILKFIVEYKERFASLAGFSRREYTTKVEDENILEDLQPSTDYAVKIALVNAVGEGDFSTEYFWKTAAVSKPSPPRINYENDFSTSKNGDLESGHADRYELQWNPSEPNGSPIRGYTIKYAKVEQDGVGNWKVVSGEEWKDTFQEGNQQTMYTIRNLEPSSHYKVILTASNGIGESDPSVLVVKTK